MAPNCGPVTFGEHSGLGVGETMGELEGGL